jgi:hypothetical protein
MGRHNLDIAHQTLHVLEDGMVDALQTIRGFAYAFGGHHKRVIDKPDP